MYERGTLKVLLFFNPQNVKSAEHLLDAYHIEKKGNAPAQHTTHDLSRHEVERYFFNEDNNAFQLLKQFSTESIKEYSNNKKKEFNRQKSGESLEKFLERAMRRHLHGLFWQLWPYLNDIRAYHPGLNPSTGNMLRQAARFEQSHVQLSFYCSKNESGHIQMHTLVSINQLEQDLLSFRQFYFFLEKQNAYYLLSYPDFQTLDWLHKQAAQDYMNDASAVLKNIVLKLEQNYTVKRNACFDENVVEEIPLPTILLSELSGQYLMLTPRWYYSGVMVDGPFMDEEQKVQDENVYTIKRNKAAEDELIHWIRQSHPNFIKQNNGYYYLTFDDAKRKSWFQHFYHQLLEKAIQLEGLDMLKHFRYSPHKPEIELQLLAEELHTLTFKVSLKFDKEKISLHEVQKVFQAGHKSILLKDNSIGLFQDEWLKQYERLFTHGRIVGENILLSKVLWFKQQMQNHESTAIKDKLNEQWFSKWNQWQQSHENLYNLPETFCAALRPYQQKGFEWLQLLSEIGAGACLADDMGLGKTIQSIAFVVYQQQLNKLAQTLVVCPTSVVHNWVKELHLFAPQLKVAIAGGQDSNAVLQDYDVLVCSYGILRNQIDQIAAKQWHNFIVDESQNIKNVNALITKAVYLVNAQHRIALSGTPVMNNTFDLFAQFDFINPDFLGTQQFFKNYYATPIDKNNNKQKLQALQQLTSLFILRRTKQQVASDLPEKTISIRWCDMSASQRLVYDEVKSQIKDNLLVKVEAEGLSKNKIQVLAGIQKLRMICAAPWLLQDTDYKSSDAVKLEVLMMDIAERLKHSKVLVFSQFLGMLDAIQDRLKKQHIESYRLDGSTKMKDRQMMIDSFQNDENSPGVFLLGLKAGNAGITLTAADYVYLVDPWWNTAVENQAIDRTHRIGQTKNVIAYKLICKDSIEEKIIQLQENKKQLADELISDEDSFVKNLSEADILYLFE